MSTEASSGLEAPDLSSKDREAQIQAGLAAKMLEFVEPILDLEAERIRTKATTILSKNEVLDGQFAVQLWAQLHGIERLRTILKRVIKKGEQAAEREPLTI